MCGGTDMSLIPSPNWDSYKRTRLLFSWKPEVLNQQADWRAFQTQFCKAPPEIMLVSKGVHEAYFDAHTLATADLRAEAWEVGQILWNQLFTATHHQHRRAC